MAVAKKKKAHFLNNADLLAELRLCHQRMADNPKLTAPEAMTNKLAMMFMLMVKRYASRGQWAQYSYLEELESEALVNLCRAWHKFDVTRENPNPFSFFTTVIQNNFRGQIDKEKKPAKIRDELLMRLGMNPSFGAQIEAEQRSSMASDD